MGHRQSVQTKIAASDQGHHCLQAYRIFYQNSNKNEQEGQVALNSSPEYTTKQVIHKSRVFGISKRVFDDFQEAKP